MNKCTLKNDDIDEIYKEIGKRVKKYRNEAGLTQLQLSLLIGHKSVSYLASAELFLDKKHFNIEQLAKIANVLNRNIKDFFD